MTLAALLAACVGPVPKIDASAAKLSAVKTIAVIAPPEPKTYTVMNFGHPGMAFGLIGGLIAGGDLNSKQDQLAAALKPQGVAVTTAMTGQLVAKLQGAGFDVALEEGPWEESDGKYKLAFEKIHSSADAVLVVSPTMVGFIATGITSDYLPTVTAVVTLLGKDRKENLYRGFHASGWAPKGDGWITAAPKTTFANFDALMADPAATAASLNAAGIAVAEEVTEKIHR